MKGDDTFFEKLGKAQKCTWLVCGSVCIETIKNPNNISLYSISINIFIIECIPLNFDALNFYGNLPM